ncbi:hypothetical protein WDW37_16790 [Bdellovibrionota bacterium FG-1]
MKTLLALFLLSFCTFTPSPVRAAESSLGILVRSALGRSVLGETFEGAQLGRLVLMRPVRTDADLESFLIRLERDEFVSLARDLELRLQRIELEILQEHATVANAAQRDLQFTRTAQGEIKFLDFHTGGGGLSSSRQHFLTPEIEEWNGKLLPLVRIPSEFRDADGRVNLADIFGTSENVAIGVSEKGNYTLIEGQNSYSGMIVGEPQLSQHPAGAPLNPGVIVRFDNPGPEVIAKLRKELTLRPASITVSCVNGACLKLKKAGVVLGGGAELPIYRTQALNRIIEAGFRGLDGKPVVFEIYMNSDQSFGDFFKEMKKMDRLIERWLRVARMRGQFNLTTQEVETFKDSMDDETRGIILALVEKGVPTLLVVAAPLLALDHR